MHHSNVCIYIYMCLSFRDIFSLGFGPFRWVCTAGTAEDLRKTDEIALSVLRDIQAGWLRAKVLSIS